jgi:hypothetical protein
MDSDIVASYNPMRMKTAQAFEFYEREHEMPSRKEIITEVDELTDEYHQLILTP